MKQENKTKKEIHETNKKRKKYQISWKMVLQRRNIYTKWKERKNPAFFFSLLIWKYLMDLRVSSYIII